jgi:hypothetical protein
LGMRCPRTNEHEKQGYRRALHERASQVNPTSTGWPHILMRGAEFEPLGKRWTNVHLFILPRAPAPKLS